MTTLEFNAEGREGIKQLEAFNPGWYHAQFVEAEMKDFAEGRGKQLVLTAQILDGPFKDRQVWERLNLFHMDAESDDKKRKMVEIAQRGMTSICQAIGQMQIRDTSELLMKPINIKVGIEPAQKDADGHVKYEAKNNIKDYKPYGPLEQSAAPAATGSAAPVAPGALPPGMAAQAAPPPAAVAPGQPPWQQQPPVAPAPQPAPAQ